MLLERDQLLATLDECLADAARDEGQMALVAGEAGAGKTALARTFATRHETAAWVSWGTCDALGTPSPLGPLNDMARDCYPLATLLGGGAARHEVFAGFLDLLVSAAQPAIVVVEDVQWADEATMDLLVFLARRASRTRAVVVVTLRDDELGAGHPLRTVLGSLANLPRVRRLHLPCLSARATAELAARSPALARGFAPLGRQVDPTHIHRLTGGNPFLVTELLRAPPEAGPDAVPETVRDAVLARVATLSPPARATLEAIAIIPTRTELALIRAVAGPTAAAAVDECAQAGIVKVVGREVSFRHELARQTVARAVPAARLPDLHAAVLAHLAHQPNPDPVPLAYHAEQADDRDAILAHAPAAAEHASRLGRHRQAVNHYEAALRHADALAPAEHAALLERYAEECHLTGRLAQGMEALDWVVARRRDSGDLAGCAQAIARRATFLLHTGTSSREAYHQAVTATNLAEGRPEEGRPWEDLPPSRELAATYAYAAYVHMHDRDRDRALAAGSRAVALATELDDKTLLAAALIATGGILWPTDPDQAETTLLRAVELARASGHAPVILGALGALGDGACEARRYRIADRWLAETVNWCHQRDLDLPRASYRARQAESQFGQGRWPQAAEIVQELARSPAGSPSRSRAGSPDPSPAASYRPARVVMLLVAGRLAVRRGEADQSSPLAAAWELATRSGDIALMWSVAAGRAEAAWHAGRAQQIPSLVGEAYRHAVDRQHPWAIGELGFWLWRAGQLAGPPERAAEPYALHISGQPAAAAAAWEALGCPYEAAEAHADGDHADHLREALVDLYRLGARPAANRLVHRLRTLGVTSLPRRPHRSTGANPAGLTDRELEVAALLGSGMSNADLAARLHISPRTAGHHVTAILTKLEVTTRHDAARAARSLGISQPMQTA